MDPMGCDVPSAMSSAPSSLSEHHSDRDFRTPSVSRQLREVDEVGIQPGRPLETPENGKFVAFWSHGSWKACNFVCVCTEIYIFTNIPCILNCKYKNAWFGCISLCQDTIIWGKTSSSGTPSPMPNGTVSSLVRKALQKKKVGSTWMIHIYILQRFPRMCIYIYTWIFQICKISATLGRFFGEFRYKFYTLSLEPGRSRYIYI